MKNNSIRTLSSLQIWLIFAVLIGGFLIRLVDLTDPPIDFHPTRQFRGATIARSIYLDSLPADHPDYGKPGGGKIAQFAALEPLILENLMAFLYRVSGGEQLWMVRIVNAALWALGGLALFNIVFSAIGFSSAIVSLTYYLFLPFGVYASRSFQSDPLMTVGVIVSIYLVHKFAENSSWINTIALAIVAGTTILIKIVAVYLIGGVMVAYVLHRGVKKSINDRKIWFLAIGMLIIPTSYYVFSGEETVAGNTSSWIIQNLPLILKPDFWLGWMKRVYAFGPVSLMLVAIGVLGILWQWKTNQSSPRNLSGKLLIGALVGYFLYGLSFPYHIPTHSYYHIQLVPIVGWAIAFGVSFIIKWANDKKIPYKKFGWLLIIGWVIFVGQKSIGFLLATDYRNEPPYWESIGEVVPSDGKTIGLVSYYGFLLRYYGNQTIDIWPDSAEQAIYKNRGLTFISYFESLTVGNQYFLVTAINQLEVQTELRDYLYDNFDIVEESAGHIIFSLEY